MHVNLQCFIVLPDLNSKTRAKGIKAATEIITTYQPPKWLITAFQPSKWLI